MNGALEPTVVMTMFPQLVTSVNFFGKVVKTFFGVAIFFGACPTALVGVHLTAAACADGTKEMEVIANRIPIAVASFFFTFTPTRLLLAVYWLHLTRLDLLLAPHW